MKILPVINVLLALVVAPFLLGVINRTKAMFAGRRGQPLLQAYYDIFKLLFKGAVYSKTTTWIFKAAPIIILSSVLLAQFLLPFGNTSSLIAFHGDVVLFIGILALARFFLVIAALDTGSAFEGMGSSREVTFSALVEPVLMLSIAGLCRVSGAFSLSGMFPVAVISSPELILIIMALFVVFLCENSRIPFDDPNTHLELTMIHEVMVLDHSGPDFAFILYGASLKMWVLGVLIVNSIVPWGVDWPWWFSLGIGLAGMLAISVLVGIIESVMARLRLLRIPQLLVGAGLLAAFAFIFIIIMRWN